MEQKRRSPLQRFKSLRLSHKMMISGGLLIFCSNLLILLLVCRTATDSLRQKTCQQLQGQLTIALSTVSSSMDDIMDLMVNLTTGSDIVDFVNGGGGYQDDYLEVVNGANESMRMLLRASNMIDYVALLRTDGEEFLYNGETIPTRQICQVLLESYAASTQLTDGSISSTMLLDYYSAPELNLFCPIFERYSIGDNPGAVLVVGINTEKMLHYVSAEDENLNIRILNLEGSVLISSDPAEIGKAEERFPSYDGHSGELNDGAYLVAYQRDKSGLWIADGSISKQILFSSIWKVAGLMSVVIVVFSFLSISVSAALYKRFYSPMQEVLSAMEKVKEGNFDTRMKDYEEQDFHQLSEGFNGMIISIKAFIEAIQRQEAENTEIRLNALQSQIKPHFLYNTLECIHWQALMEGAPEASKMVMTLSRYYRLCLSKGADVVSLDQELEHTESYVAIQNMRFDNILAVEYDIASELRGMEIPKITLQPLVENAIYHGIKPVEEKKGHVLISGKQEGGMLVLTVADDGIGMAQEEIDRLNSTIDQLINDGSYGVKNVHKRLEIRYGKGSGLHYQRNESGGITVTIRLPARKLLRKERQGNAQHFDRR